MDREDAAFVADVLECRIAGNAAELTELAASSLMRLTCAAARVRELADGWPPALLAAAELMAIAKMGGAVCEHALEGDIQPFIDIMRKLAGEKPRRPLNRAERRAMISGSGRKRLIAGRPPGLVGFR